jgi:hypothetical protein
VKIEWACPGCGSTFRTWRRERNHVCKRRRPEMGMCMGGGGNRADHDDTALEEINGVTVVYCPKRGQFKAAVGHQVLARKELGSLRREIRKRTEGEAIKAMIWYGVTSGVPGVTEVTKEGNRYRDDRGELLSSVWNYYRYDEEVYQALRTLVIEANERRAEERDRVEALLGRVEKLEE